MIQLVKKDAVVIIHQVDKIPHILYAHIIVGLIAPMILNVKKIVLEQQIKEIYYGR
jgi:hypothetical protein